MPKITSRDREVIREWYNREFPEWECCTIEGCTVRPRVEYEGKKYCVHHFQAVHTDVESMANSLFRAMWKMAEVEK